MDSLHAHGCEQELRALVTRAEYPDIAAAACRGVDPNTYHPESGAPDPLALLRCSQCPVRLACIAVALRAEDGEARAGWYGGLGPEERHDVAARLGLIGPTPITSDDRTEAARLRGVGWTIGEIAAHLGCCRRTVQRYLKLTA